MLQVLNSLPENSEEYKAIVAELEKENNIPACLRHIWEWFWELRTTAGSGFSAPNPITYTEISNWANLKHIQIYPHEVEIIKELDCAFINFQANKVKSKGKK